MRRRIVRCFLAVVLAVSLSGCGNSGVALAEGVSFTDALGREVSVRSPQRVLAMMGGFAEAWQLAGGELAGVTQDAVTQRNLELPPDIVVVGEYNSPSTEAILAMEPDFVLLSSETAAHLSLRDLLESAGIPFAYFSVTHFEDYLEMLRICTQLTGRDDLYQQNGLEVQVEIAAEKARQRTDSPSALLLITYSGGAVAQDSSSMTGKMLAELGCLNLADENPSLLREFSLEYILTADPDYIFVIPMGNDEAAAETSLRETLGDNAAWNSLSAVVEGRYHILSKELFLYKPNHRWAESYEFLAQCLVP